MSADSRQHPPPGPSGPGSSGDLAEPPAAVRPGSGRRPGRVLGLLVLSGLVVLAVRMVVVQSFVIPTASMEPTLQVGDRVLVSRWEDRFGSVHRGDVVVFDGSGVFDPQPAPAGTLLESLGRGLAALVGSPVGERDYVKRVIGLPGERVTCCDAANRITVDGRPLTEPYLRPGESPSDLRFDIRVPAGRLWVMGDHRSDSGDSRNHLGDPGGGTVPLDHVVGRVVAVWWPWDRLGGVGRADGSGQPDGSTAPTAQEARL